PSRSSSGKYAASRVSSSPKPWSSARRTADRRLSRIAPPIIRCPHCSPACSAARSLPARKRRPRRKQVVRDQRRGPLVELEQVIDGLIPLLEDAGVDVPFGDLAQRDDGGLVVLPLDHRMGAVRELDRKSVV